MKMRDNISVSKAKFAEWDKYYQNLVQTARSKCKNNTTNTKSKKDK